MPMIDGSLTGNEGGTASVTIRDDLHQMLALCGIDFFHPQVVEDQQFGLLQPFANAHYEILFSVNVTPVAASEQVEFRAMIWETLAQNTALAARLKSPQRLGADQQPHRSQLRL